MTEEEAKRYGDDLFECAQCGRLVPRYTLDWCGRCDKCVNPDIEEDEGDGD